jgi:LmbE family N-acetylglucosaminyl deacetylase
MSRCALSVSPHPDDELIGAGATLMALRDAGWRVINLACSLGRSRDRARRRAELTEACRLAGFELLIPDGLPPIGGDDDLALAQQALSAAIVDALDSSGAELIVGPSPHDGHHGHEVVGRAIRDAAETRAESTHVLFWGLWSDLPLPNVLVPFDAERLNEIWRALAAHAGELARNRFDRLVESRAAANAVLGPERVFGFGTHGADHTYAELLTEVTRSAGEPWRLTTPRELDAAQPPARADGPEIGWWLHLRSVRSVCSGRDPS